jgi:hypothetical protein
MRRSGAEARATVRAKTIVDTEKASLGLADHDNERGKKGEMELTYTKYQKFKNCPELLCILD